MRPTESARRAAALGLAAAAVLAAGCGDRRKTTYPVRGRVVDARKQPAAGAVVTLQPVAADPGDPARPTGTADDHGYYTLTTYTAGDGAPAGEYVVTAVWPPPRKTPFDPPGGDKLGGKLAAADKSPHRFTVEPRPDQEVPTVTLP